MLPLPPILQAQAELKLQQLGCLELLTEQHYAALSLSDFICDNLCSHPQWWRQLHSQPPADDEWQTYAEQLTGLLQGVVDEEVLMRELRLFRRQMLMRIAWSQAMHSCSTQETLQQLTVLAETLVIAARDWLYRSACREWGTPCDEQGVPQPLLILGMGKLGGGELNFSSDIDLILTYPAPGETRGGRRQWDNGQFFTRLSQRLLKVLGQQTVDGLVYRVDMRLRPFGESGPLVLSFAALEEYYQEQGRDWERYAMVKARLLGSEQQHYGQQLQQLLRPFIFRRYIDFSVIQSLRNMKGMIAREVRRRGLSNNIKLGAGGIREIEFIAQVFQLIRGGREPSLQNRALLPTLQAIAKLELLPLSQVALLEQHYLFLRRLENLLQAIHDQQTQTLPDDPLNQARLAWGMGYADWQALFTELQHRMVQVREIFAALIGEELPSEPQALAEMQSLWLVQLEPEELAPLLPALTDGERQGVQQILQQLRLDINKRTIGPRGRAVLDQLLPRLLAKVCDRTDVQPLLQRLIPLLLNIITRTAYLELLLENQAALTHLVTLCAASPMVAHQLAHYPLLLDELLDPVTLYRPTPLNAYRDELRQYLLRVEQEDEEQYLEALRQFKQAQQLRIAAADIVGVLPVMQVSDHLTYLAEAIIEAVFQRAWRSMLARYGQPAHLVGDTGQGFAVLGYGKLGGWELGYRSDLDLVFLIDCPPQVVTDGPRAIDGRQFYLRLAQRILHLFSARTASGILYEVDARLRPSGEAGLLVSTLQSFEEYQRDEAWIWEHQALVRARMVYGDTAMRQRFNAIRQQVLCRPRDQTTLQREVREMRRKMYQHLGGGNAELFDIKNDPGGITDIEFIAQYLVLNFAARKPKLTRWSDNVRIFELMAEYGIMPLQEARTLMLVYVTMRDKIHHLSLQECDASVSIECFAAERAQVRESWRRWISGE